MPYDWKGRPLKILHNIFQVLSLPLYWNEGWTRFHSDLENLAKCLKCYTENLEGENCAQLCCVLLWMNSKLPYVQYYLHVTSV